ncbi:MAG: thioredoxin-like domain-containing protein [Alphaproteobacteria bacterium]|nr:thioredoxin-like domain-containing protein [Alphaproteobacteria bacterium]
MKLFSVLMAAILLVAGQVQAKSGEIFETLAEGGAGGWLNVTRPVTVEDMKGKILLLDFWTYGCVNCMQIVPDLDFLEKKYGDKLLIIGVHSAKYKGEQDSARILSASKRFGLHHPVINDYDFAIWKSLGVKAWPTLILWGPDGKEISRYSGEGHLNELDKDINDHIGQASNATSNANLIDQKKSHEPLSFPARIESFQNGFAIADSGHHQIALTDENGKITDRIGNGQKSLKDGTYETASFNNPRGLKTIGSKIYVADTDNHALRVIDTKQRTVTTLAGNGKRGYNRNLDRDQGTSISLASPWDLEILPNSDNQKLVIALAGLHQLGVYDIPSGKISVIAGSGYEDIEDGTADKSKLAQPSGLTTDGTAIYFVDAESSSLRMLKDGQVKTLIGTGLFDYGLVDGTYPKAMLQHAQGLDYANGKIYLADTYNDAIRIYDLKTGQLSTLVKGKDISEPGDILFSGEKLLIVNTGGNSIKEILPDRSNLIDFPVK